MGKPPIKLAFSAGGVVFRSLGSEVEIALIKTRNSWTLPKGLIEKGEKPEIAALREVEEETGLKVELQNPLGSIEYWFYSPEEKVRYHKKVYFFLFKAIGGDINDHDFEVEEVKFFKPEEALNLVTYSGDKEILKKSLEVIYSKLNI